MRKRSSSWKFTVIRPCSMKTGTAAVGCTRAPAVHSQDQGSCGSAVYRRRNEAMEELHCNIESDNTLILRKLARESFSCEVDADKTGTSTQGKMSCKEALRNTISSTSCRSRVGDHLYSTYHNLQDNLMFKEVNPLSSPFVNTSDDRNGRAVSACNKPLPCSFESLDSSRVPYSSNAGRQSLASTAFPSTTCNTASESLYMAFTAASKEPNQRRAAKGPGHVALDKKKHTPGPPNHTSESHWRRNKSGPKKSCKLHRLMHSALHSKWGPKESRLGWSAIPTPAVKFSPANIHNSMTDLNTSFTVSDSDSSAVSSFEIRKGQSIVPSASISITVGHQAATCDSGSPKRTESSDLCLDSNRSSLACSSFSRHWGEDLIMNSPGSDKYSKDWNLGKSQCAFPLGKMTDTEHTTSLNHVVTFSQRKSQNRSVEIAAVKETVVRKVDTHRERRLGKWHFVAKDESWKMDPAQLTSSSLGEDLKPPCGVLDHGGDEREEEVRERRSHTIERAGDMCAQKVDDFRSPSRAMGPLHKLETGAKGPATACQGRSGGRLDVAFNGTHRLRPGDRKVSQKNGERKWALPDWNTLEAAPRLPDSVGPKIHCGLNEPKVYSQEKELKNFDAAPPATRESFKNSHENATSILSYWNYGTAASTRVGSGPDILKEGDESIFQGAAQEDLHALLDFLNRNKQLREQASNFPCLRVHENESLLEGIVTELTLQHLQELKTDSLREAVLGENGYFTSRPEKNRWLYVDDSFGATAGSFMGLGSLQKKLDTQETCCQLPSLNSHERAAPNSHGPVGCPPNPTNVEFPSCDSSDLRDCDDCVTPVSPKDPVVLPKPPPSETEEGGNRVTRAGFINASSPATAPKKHVATTDPARRRAKPIAKIYCLDRLDDAMKKDSAKSACMHNDSSEQHYPEGISGAVQESIALAKNTTDPYSEFCDSMLEMMKEKNLCSREDLEDLLQCFLHLNAPVHHGLIQQAFSDVCHDQIRRRANLSVRGQISQPKKGHRKECFANL